MSSILCAINNRLFSRSEKPKIVDWLLFIVICLISFLLFCQGGDLNITAQHSVILLDATIHGQFFHFYTYVYDLVSKGGSSSPAYYSVFLYGTFSIWNLPLWLFSKITGIAINSFVLMMWSKTLILVCTLYSGYLVYKIGLTLKMAINKSKWMMFVYLTSPILMFGTVIFGQYDIFGVVATLLGILMFLKKKPYQFAMFMALAISYKNFAALIFIPLILLTEKSVFHIIKYYAIGFSLFLLQNIVFFLSDPGYVKVQVEGESTYGFFHSVFTYGLPSGYGVSSYIGITFMILCAFAYRKNIKNAFELGQYTIYIPLVIYGVFFAFLGWHPQWVVILVPYMVIAAFNCKDFKLSMFIDIAMSIGYMLMSMIKYVDNVDQNMINAGILPKLFHVSYDNSVTFADIATKAHIPYELLITLFVGAIFVNIIIKFPGLNKNTNVNELKEETTFVPERSVLWVRALSIFIFILPTLVLYFHFLIKNYLI